MTVKVYPRFALITNEEIEPIDVCDNCKKEWKRGMLCEVKDYFQRVEPYGIVPSGECPDPECGALCYPKEVLDLPLREWLQEAAWIYPVADKEFLALLEKNLKAEFGEDCRVWQNSKVGNAEYPQLICSADLKGYGGDTCHMWRDGQTWWPMVGDYSLDDMEKAELVLRKTILESRDRAKAA
jgi:hypothetical protein